MARISIISMGKILLATAILGLGIAGAFFSIQNTGLSASQNSIIDVANNNLIIDGPFVEKINDKNQAMNGGLGITDEFTNNLAKKISEANPSGPKMTAGKRDIVAPNPDDIALELIADAASKFDVEKLIPEIKDSDIKINQGNTKELVLKYSDTFDVLVFKYRLDTLGDMDFSEEMLNRSIKNYEDLIREFYNLEVPKMMVAIHKTEIKYLSAQLNLLEKIRDAQTDPLMALLAAENFAPLEKQFNKEITAQTMEFIDAYKKL